MLTCVDSKGALNYNLTGIKRPEAVTYEKFANKDKGGSDIKCYDDGRSLDKCQLECASNTACAATNYVKPNGVWGAKSGCCLKNVSGPTVDANGIDFYVKK